MVRRLLILLALVGGLALTACATTVPPTVEGYGATPPAFTLGAGDRLRIVVFGETTVTGEYPVGTDGMVALPLIGPTMAGGKSPEQFQQEITAKFAGGFILQPRVTVDVIGYRPYFILGEVAKPGQYPYLNALSLTQAVATAGGYSYRANTRRAFIRRAGRPNEEQFEVSGDKPVWIMPGDTVRIGERYF